VDELWETKRIKSGLVSGEGLKWHVRDPADGNEKGEKNDAGVSDKRLLAYQSEFVSVLSVCQRTGNTLSADLRDAGEK